MNNELRTNKAFTLIELTVAVALLAIMMGFSGVIFKVSIESHRLATSNAEIMQKFRAITDQLNSDFKGLRKDAPLLIWFELDPITRRRYDQIMFFADGDFQSTQLYDLERTLGVRIPSLTGWPVRGNVARIYYGHADLINYKIYDYIMSPIKHYWDSQMLARRCHILTVHPDLTVDPRKQPVLFPDIASLAAFEDTFLPFTDWSRGGGNNRNEHDSVSLAHWKLITENRLSLFNDRMIITCFDTDIGRPKIDTADSSTLHMLLAEGLDSLKIQWAYWYEGPTQSAGVIAREFRWWPSVDPDKNGDLATDSDFRIMSDLKGISSAFGIYFNIGGPSLSSALIRYWYPASAARTYWIPISPVPSGGLPKALKFTFTLYDSKGVIENGRTFTHIVYLDD